MDVVHVCLCCISYVYIVIACRSRKCVLVAAVMSMMTVMLAMDSDGGDDRLHVVVVVGDGVDDGHGSSDYKNMVGCWLVGWLGSLLDGRRNAGRDILTTAAMAIIHTRK